MSDFKYDIEEAAANRLAVLQRELDGESGLGRVKRGTFLMQWADGKTLLDSNDLEALLAKHEGETVTGVLRVAGDFIGRVQPRMVAALVKPKKFAIILVAKK